MYPKLPAVSRHGRRQALRLLLAGSVGMLGWAGAPAYAASDLVVGTVLPLSGTFAEQGANYQDGMRLYQEMHGTQVAGRTIKLVFRDDQGPGSGDTARRLTQELITRDKAELIVGYSFTPNAMSAASLLTQAKTPGIIINAMTSVITEKSPYFTRISGTLAMVSYTLGKWVASQGKKTAYTIAADYAPGVDAETWFIKGFTEGGGKILGSDRTPITAMEYGPFLQRAVETKPDVLFGFNPGGDVSIAFMKQAGTRLKGTGIQLVVTGDVVDESLLPAMGDAAIGTISSWYYQTDIDNPANKAFLKAFHAKFGAGKQPGARVLQGYDAMDLVYKTLAKTSGKTGDAFMAAVKGMRLDSPRGPVLIDPKTRDIVQNIYIRRTTKVNGQLVNQSFAKIENVRDPAKQ
ncbi:Branched-chain amino acid transport system substrate-binding protein OS=Castellaniella defragrans OX=75697 GN=HNR28_001882 PE=3 SV=1 [Castellaniella defragrans]